MSGSKASGIERAVNIAIIINPFNCKKLKALVNFSLKNYFCNFDDK